MNFALKYRPKTIEEIVGQEELVSKNSAFYRLLKSKNTAHSLFFGPPGSGKTTLAYIIAKEIGNEFYKFDASSIKI